MADAAWWRFLLLALWPAAILACLVGSGGVSGALPLAWRRVAAAATVSPSGHVWTVLAALAIVLPVLPFGLASGFLQRPQWQGSVSQVLTVGAVSFFAPGLLEELLFRVIALPGKEEDFNWSVAMFMVLVFSVVYHTDAIHRQHEVFDDWRFLCASLAIGAACTFVYARTGSWWLAAVVHWLPVWLWLSFSGGKEKIDQANVNYDALSTQEPVLSP
jgi:predicted Abi (CAAX) family protease